MERIGKGEEITLDDNKDYYVFDVVEQSDKRYLYLVNQKEKELLIAEELIDNDDIIIETVTDENKIMEIVKIVKGRIKKD